MCGICGWVEGGGSAPDPARLSAMVGALHHRGPDGRGTWLAPGVALGHVRLSILDLSDAASQPMVDPATGVVLTYNGEVYNFPELRAELEALGHRFHSSGDTEVVLRAWIAWGPAALERLNGMFAFAVWDPRDGSLHLARDRFGIKPLVYGETATGLMFASEAKALHAGGLAPGEVDPQGLHEVLVYGATLGQTTMWRGVRKLPAAGHLVWRAGSPARVRIWWDPADLEPLSPRDPDTAAAELARHLEAAVRRHLLSDVPVGVFMSGGIDSSAMAAFAARHHSGRLRTYSADFDFAPSTELPRARRTAAALGTDHHELRVGVGEVPDLIRLLTRAHDQPFADTANIPLYLICRALGGDVKVVLQGDGGDEIFAGYRRYALLARLGLWRRPGALLEPVLSRLPAGRRRDRVLRMAHALGHDDPAMRMALLLTVDSDLEPPARVLAPGWRYLEADPWSRYRIMAERYAHLEPVQRMLYTDSRVILPDVFLEKVDKPTMALGIEVRVPMLDAELTRFAMALPASYKVRRGQKKWLLRKALRGVVPDEVLDGPKRGFGVPIGQWLAGPLAGWMREVLLDPAVSDLLDRHQVATLIDAHTTGRRDHGTLLARCVALAVWATQRCDP